MKALPILALLTFLLASLSIAGCDMDEGPAEKVGEDIDNAVEETGEAIENVGDKIRDKTQ